MARRRRRRRRHPILAAAVSVLLLVGAYATHPGPMIFLTVCVLLLGIGVGVLRHRFGWHREAMRVRVRDSRTIPQSVKIAVSARDGGRCRMCGSREDLQYDHIFPWSRGGSSTDPNNIQLLCGRHNRAKSDRV